MQEFVSDPSRVATRLHVPTEASDCSEFEVKEASGLLGWIRAGKLWQAMESAQTHSKDSARSIECESLL